MPKLKSSGGHFDIDNKEEKKASLEKESLVEGFWNDNKKAKEVMRELETLKAKLKSFYDLNSAVDDIQVLIEFFNEDSSDDNLKELEILIDPKGKLLRAAGGRGLPTTILIDQQGYEVGRLLGVADWDAPKSIHFLKRCLGS